MIKTKALTTKDTNILKGLAMLMIMFHNFFHQIHPNTGENEFSFNPQFFQNFLNLVANDSFNFIRYFFSYFGHYGVQIFILVSGYGLYMGYKDRATPWWPFMKKRLNKLYPTLVIGIVLVVLIYVFVSGRFPSVHMVKHSLLKLTLLYNFIPHAALTVSGPWWFFSLIVQLYAIFPILKNLTKKFGRNAMLVIAFLFILLSIAFVSFIDIHGFSIYYTFVGQLPVFALGIYFAARPEIKIHTTTILVSLIVFAAGSIYQGFWFFSFMAVAILLLAAMIALIPVIRRFKKVDSFITFTGSISLFLFVIHGALRVPFVRIAERYPNPLLEIALSLAFMALSFAMALLVRIIEKQVQEYIASGYKLKTLLVRVKSNDW